MQMKQWQNGGDEYALGLCVCLLVWCYTHCSNKFPVRTTGSVCLSVYLSYHILCLSKYIYCIAEAHEEVSCI